ncbi:hypothetical protein A2824_03800 [Candidatus Nomurabacteria bacterium RIFCSPHIGHO2_01_FULL_42_16]|uniref:Uncharacterized protein n=1 Tax=Candidatus Nomurabacteria bacterium RIFCSPHIGHO2_01_FULL_42_16 TaxID=1801743 RepID=A0A1F6VLH3_9BACT|nr:MAG: hypothetical protein A2824_03800 [Candidatus Nomurabacteria bacterium RIFCSPHIGHO2_01_FULL_42_16]
MEKSPQIKQNPSLVEAYKLVHNEEPVGMSDYEITRRIIEVIGNENWIPKDLNRKVISAIKSVEYPDEETKKKTLIDLEDFLAYPVKE